MWFNSKKKKEKKSRIETTYDGHNQEISALLDTSFFQGIRTEINKIVSPWLQLSGIEAVNREKTATQIFATMSFPYTMTQLSFDTNKSYQGKGTVSFGPFLGRLHSIISPENDVYGHLEGMYRTTLGNICVKLIKPAFEASNLIYILNSWCSFCNLGWGIEAVGVKNRVGVSFAARIKRGGDVITANIQRFNLLTVSFYKQITSALAFGAETRISADTFELASGIRVINRRSEVKCTLNQHLQFGVFWSERLSETLTVSFSGLYGVGGFDHGVSVTFDS